MLIKENHIEKELRGTLLVPNTQQARDLINAFHSGRGEQEHEFHITGIFANFVHCKPDKADIVSVGSELKALINLKERYR